jgi:hypothetical protein
MVFGMVTRYPYPGAWGALPKNNSGGSFNQQLWGFWDKYNLRGSDMRGWWSDTTPVTIVGNGTSASNSVCGSAVVATAYVIKGKHTVVSAASWSNYSVECAIAIDWAAIGIDRKSVKNVAAPAVAGFQRETSFAVDATGLVTGIQFERGNASYSNYGNGWLVVIES